MLTTLAPPHSNSIRGKISGMARGQCYKTFTAVIYKWAKQFGVVAPSKPFKPSQPYHSLEGSFQGFHTGMLLPLTLD